MTPHHEANTNPIIRTKEVLTVRSKRFAGSNLSLGLTALFFLLLRRGFMLLPGLVGHVGKRSRSPGLTTSSKCSALPFRWSCGTCVRHSKFVPTYRSSPHHGKLAQSGPRDDGFRSGLSVFLTYTSESPAEWALKSNWDDLSWWS